MPNLNKIKKLFSKTKQPMNKPNPSAERPLSETNITQDTLVDLMHRLEKTMTNAYSCEEAFALLDEYVELVADDEEAAQLMPLVKNHIDMCPDCRDKFEILLHILKTADSEA